MKLTEALREITVVSGSKEQNLRNYLRSLNYISNLYKFRKAMNEVCSGVEIKYLPTFKDIYISEEIGIATITEENELRLISVQSPFFLVDENYKKITVNLKTICNKIERENDIITFYLK